MIDFTWSEHTLGNIFYCLISYGLFIVLYYKRYVNVALSQKSKTNVCMILYALVLIITTCVDTDWFHYRDMVHDYDFTLGAINHGELVYWYIIKVVHRNYILFRLVVWGGAFILTCFAINRFGTNINIAVFLLISVFLVKFNYARATLGMASYFVGLSYILKPKNRMYFLNMVCAALFLWGAYEFHHSMLLLVLLTPVVFIPMDRPVLLLIVILALPLIASILNQNFFFIDQFGNEYLSGKLNNYLAVEGTKSNFFGIIQSILGYGVIVLPLIIESVVLMKKHKEMPLPIIKLYRMIIGIVIMAVSFLFMNLESVVFVYRILYMSIIPLTIITAYLYEHEIMSKKGYKVIVLWGILSISYVILHLLYSHF